MKPQGVNIKNLIENTNDRYGVGNSVFLAMGKVKKPMFPQIWLSSQPMKPSAAAAC